MNKPASKVIQISTHQVPGCPMITTALCEDGSIWYQDFGYRSEWVCILEPFKNFEEVKENERITN